MPQPPQQQPPPVQRLRVRYAKRGRLRFSSHRDFSRVLERAIARARLPMAYSSGFHPHPRISYAGAVPTGAASEAEYLEIGLASAVDPEQVRAVLASSLPDGLDVLEVVESPGGPLAGVLEASVWEMRPAGEPHQGSGADRLAEAVATFLARDEVLVERVTKRGPRTFDAREAVLDLSVTEDPPPVGLRLVLRHTEPAVRAEDVLTGLRATVGADLLGRAALVRLAQGPLRADGSVADPLAPPE